MSVRGKRLWPHRLDFASAFGEVESFVRRTREHNLLPSTPAMLYQAYLMDGNWPTESLEELSSYLRFGPKDSPQIDRGRATLARLLAVAVKAHFFLAEDGIVPYEPYVFSQPDVSAMGQMRYGLIYPLEIEQRLQCIMVAEWDLGLTSSRRPKGNAFKRFPAVLVEQDFRWLNLPHWQRLSQQAVTQLGSTEAFARKTFAARAKAHTDLATFAFGTPLDYPRELNPDVMAAGGMWANGIRKWFLPTGFDVEATREYLDLQLTRTATERHDLRWWDFQLPPRDEK